MYHAEFNHPDRSTVRLIVSTRRYFDPYITSLMCLYDLIGELTETHEPRHFTHAEIHEKMAAMLKPDVYLSFSIKDRLDEAVNLTNQLRAYELNVWTWLPGTYVPPENWMAPLPHSTSFVTIISPEAVKSHWVPHEWAMAKENSKPIFAVFATEADGLLITPHLGEVAGTAYVGHKVEYQLGVADLRKKIEAIKQARLADHLPFGIAENIRQNYDAARRILLFAFRPDDNYLESARTMVENGTLDVQLMAARYIKQLLRTYKTLQIIQQEMGFEPE